jgi:hypothetical protein
MKYRAFMMMLCFLFTNHLFSQNDTINHSKFYFEYNEKKVQLDTISDKFEIAISVTKMTENIEVEFHGIIIGENFYGLSCSGSSGGTCASWENGKTKNGEKVTFNCMIMGFEHIEHTFTRQMYIRYSLNGQSTQKNITFRIEKL